MAPYSSKRESSSTVESALLVSGTAVMLSDSDARRSMSSTSNAFVIRSPFTATSIASYAPTPSQLWSSTHLLPRLLIEHASRNIQTKRFNLVNYISMHWVFHLSSTKIYYVSFFKKQVSHFTAKRFIRK